MSLPIKVHRVVYIQLCVIEENLQHVVNFLLFAEHVAYENNQLLHQRVFKLFLKIFSTAPEPVNEHLNYKLE